MIKFIDYCYFYFDIMFSGNRKIYINDEDYKKNKKLIVKYKIQ